MFETSYEAQEERVEMKSFQDLKIQSQGLNCSVYRDRFYLTNDTINTPSSQGHEHCLRMVDRLNFKDDHQYTSCGYISYNYTNS